MSAKVQVDKYFSALQRLIARRASISNDAVALEAGSGRGAIKASRPAYKQLVEAIDEAAKKQAEQNAASDPLPALRAKNESLSLDLDRALEREVCLLYEVRTLREEIRQLRLGRPMAVSPSTPAKPERKP